MQFDQVTVIGGGLAGSECAIQLADRGFAVKLCEMRPQVSSPAHHTDHLAELVCSNSFKSTRPDSAAGLLKAELERMGSVLLDCAHRAAVPAGGALAVDRVVLKDFEGGDLFQACQPAEEVARTGKDAIRFGAMKPVGLTDPRTGRRPWAAIQLRAENKEKTAYNLVGFQTNLTFGEQKRVFHMVPGLENAEFFRYGVMHRNTFVDAPHVLDSTFAVPGTGVRLAGQITGTEGYMEAVATGLLAALNTYAEAIGAAGVELPRVGALGALVGYATDPATVGYQPMHVNFGLVPPLEDGKRRSKRDRYQAYADRALEALDAYLATRSDLFGGDRS